jgi:hypothetical protein
MAQVNFIQSVGFKMELLLLIQKKLRYVDFPQLQKNRHLIQIMIQILAKSNRSRNKKLMIKREMICSNDVVYSK